MLALATAVVGARPADDALSAARSVDRFAAQHPGSKLGENAGRITKVYGAPFSHGETAAQSAEQFRQQNAGLFGVAAADLFPTGPAGGAPVEQPVLFDPATGAYRFTAHYYRQASNGVPVFRSRLVLLVRNEPGHPLVLASADLRDLGGFQADPGRIIDDALVQAAAEVALGDDAPVAAPTLVVWAGVDDQPAEPRLAAQTIAGTGVDKQLLLIDVATGEVLYQEAMVYQVDVPGNVSGLATTGPGSEQCEPELSRPLPYVQVVGSGGSTFTDINGDFIVPTAGLGLATISSSLNGMWFDVFDFTDNPTAADDTVSPPSPATLLYNGANTDPIVRAQVNAYVESNVVRDFVLVYNPAYPTLDQSDFPVTVNRTDGFCPGNAWYDSGDQSINFCQEGGGHPNTSWSSVVYHEYGHHLVNAGGSGQGAYGEGMGDCVSTLILDSPDLGLGFHGPCDQWLRNADNNCQYQSPGCSSCGSSGHACGQLLSGCVWSLRQELAVTEPADYLDIVSALTINSILLHNGTSINPSITVDFLTLDDDNANIMDGTPHYAEIAAAFGAHNMPAPPLAAIAFNFPDGLPATVSPNGGAAVRVEVTDVAGTAQSGTGMFHYSIEGGSFSSVAMDEISGNMYDAIFPAADCTESIDYYFSAQSTGGATQTYPVDAPASTLQAVAAESVTDVFVDDFESDQGWSVSTTAIDGGWDRGVPVGGGDRGDPPTDADGSGQCYLTDNVDGNTDVDEGATTLTSPIMDASVGGTFLSYWRWFSNTGGSNPNQDTFLVEISDNGGGSWSLLEIVGPSGLEADGGWFYRQHRVEDYVAATSQLRVRFIAADIDPQSVVEAAVDAIELRSFSCTPGGTPCPADITGDLVVNVDDLVQVITHWGEPGGGTGDVNGDEIVDTDDLVAVIVAWGPCVE